VAFEPREADHSARRTCSLPSEQRLEGLRLEEIPFLPWIELNPVDMRRLMTNR